MANRIAVLDCLRLAGPNLHADWPCIQWTIDLGEFEARPSNQIPRFCDRIKTLIPSLVEHHCSEGDRGGFFCRLDDGTWLGHVMEHIAIEIQNLAGAHLSFGRTRSAGREGVYDVVYECEEVEIGERAGKLAMEILDHLIDGRTFDIASAIASLAAFRSHCLLGPSGQAIVDAAHRRGIPTIRLNQGNFVQLGYGSRAKRIQATTTSLTLHHAVEIAGDKDLTKRILESHGVPVPSGDACRTFEQALAIATNVGYPLAVKPLDASKGRGIMTNVGTEKELAYAFKDAQRYSSDVVIEKHISGNDYRFLVIGGRFIAAAQRIPARVIGDGLHTIEELVELENRDPRRGEGHENLLTKIEIDAVTEHLLQLRGLTRQSISPKGDRVYLKTTANLSTGGFAVDVTERVHPENQRLVERIARLIGLDIAGIDIVSETVEIPVAEVGGAVVEVNAAPGFRMHVAPTEGKPRPVGEAVIDLLFPNGAESRIPLLTITGTNGKTTTARLCAHIASEAGFRVGLTTTDGIYVEGRRIIAGDCTGPQSARVVLTEPDVDFAVLETARGGILRAGLAYDSSDVAVVTNISADHLGLRGVETIEDLARVKGLTVEKVSPRGYAVLNADDAMTCHLIERTRGAIALFALDRWNQLFGDHVATGGIGVTVERDEIVLYRNGKRASLLRVDAVPLTFNGRARFNIANVLAAVAAMHCSGIELAIIQPALKTFHPNSDQAPGRMNAVDVNGVNVIIDYGHNAAGFAAVAEFVAQSPKKRAIAVVGVPGDRRDVDIIASGRALASAFDLVVVREDFDRRGRARGETAALLRAGLIEGGLRAETISIIVDEDEAIDYALRIALSGDLLVYFADDIERATRRVEDHRLSRATITSSATA